MSSPVDLEHRCFDSYFDFRRVHLENVGNFIRRVPEAISNPGNQFQNLTLTI